MFKHPIKSTAHLWVIYGIAIMMLGVIWYVKASLGIVMTLLLMLSIYYTVRQESKKKMNK